MPNTSSLTKIAEVGGSLKQVQQAFQSYQVARMEFINQLTTFLDKKDPQNITLEALMKNDVMGVLCCPLASDPVPGVQSLSLSCLSKLAGADPLLSQVVVTCGVLDSVVQSMSHNSPPVQAAADGVLSAVARSTTDNAHNVMMAGALPPLLEQLHSAHTPPAVKESAVSTLDSLIQSSEANAAAICNPELLSTLVALMLSADSPHSLCKAIVKALGNIAAVSSALADAVVAQNALDPLTRLARGSNTPPDLKAAALHSLSHVCSHDEALANKVAETGVVPVAVQALADRMTPSIRRNAALLLLQMVQKTPELAEAVSAAGAPACLRKYMPLERGNEAGARVGIMMAGSLACYNAFIAKALVDSCSDVMVDSIGHRDASISAAGAWAIEQAAAHGPDVAMALVAQNCMRELVTTYARTRVTKPELKAKLKSAIKAVIRNCNATGPLEAFISPSTPPELAKHLLARLHVLLQDDPKARQQMVTSGALARLQKLSGLDAKGQQHADAINTLFPPDVVAYYEQAAPKLKP